MASLDARALRDAMSRYLEALRTHREEIDSLNVYPVPDGDTGTNLLLTQQAVDEALGDADDGLAGAGAAISRAALMGARGNSGVILSQVLRGLCDRLSGVPQAGPSDLAEALRLASEEARQAVARPAEGTMLSVIRDAARAAAEEAATAPDAGTVAEAALEEGLRSLERTRSQLPELEAAGVVDAGGKGIVLLLDALAASLTGAPPRVEVGPRGPVGERAADAAAPAGSTYGYEVMYLLEAADDRVPDLRERLSGIGDSLVVVGGGGLYNVHVHTDQPGPAVEAGVDAGRPRDIRITSLDEQVEACVAGEARAVRVEAGDGRAAVAGPPPTEGRTALVAVAPGEGVARLLRSCGATVVSGGPGRNPSVAELLEAIEGAPAEEVVLLPNHRNILPAAKRAAAESDRRVEVIPTRSVPEGIAAAAGFDPERPAEENAAHAREAAAAVTSVEVAPASRDADTPAGPVRRGQFLGIAGGEANAVGDDPVEVAVATVRPLVDEEHEVLTLLVGRDVEADVAERAERALRDAFPALELEVHRGDQPHYPFLIGLE